MAYGFPKPLKGSYLLERKNTRAAHVAAEQSVMQQSKRRDSGKCRVPRCEYAKRDLPVDPCHFNHRGMGGNPKGDRTTTDQVISMCRIHHSMFDRGDLHIEPMTQDGANGPCAFYVRDEPNRPVCVGVERTIGVSVTRGA